MTGRLLFALLLCACTLVACGTEAPPAEPSPWMTLVVQVDDGTPVTVQLPESAIGTAVAALSVDGLPPYRDWAMLEIRGADGRVLRMKSPATRPGDEARFVLDGDQPAVGLFLLVAQGASASVRAAATKPQQLVLRPRTVRIHTTLPEPPGDKLGVLRTQVNGRGAGQLRPAELATLTVRPEPGRPQHEGGYAVADLVALRADLRSVTQVEIVAKDAAPIVLRPDTAGWTGSVLKPNKKGEWVFKQPAEDPQSPRERGQTLRSVDLLAIRTASSP